MSRENDKLQRQVKELTEDTHKSKTSEDQFKNLMHSMKHFQARTIVSVLVVLAFIDKWQYLTQ